MRKHDKLLEYRRLLRANETISVMKMDLGENAIDRFLVSEEGFERDRDIFDQAVTDLKAMLGSIYPESDFSQFDAEVAKAQRERVRPESEPVEDLSLKFSEVKLSEGEPTEVSSDDERFTELPGEDGDSAKK